MIDVEQRKSLISNFPCFSQISDQELTYLASLCEEIHYNSGHAIVTEGDVVDSVYIIVEGKAEVILKNQDRSPIAILRPSEGIGLNDLGFYSKTGLRTASVIASSDIVLLRLSVQSLNEFLERYPEINQIMAQTAKKMLRMSLIKDAAPFVELSKDQIQWLEEKIIERHYEPNEIIFTEGESGDSCYLIYSGKVDIFTTDEAGKEHSLAHLGKSDLFGEIALITSALRNASARALESTTLLILYRKDFLELMNQSKPILEAITTSMLDRMRPSMNKQTIIYQRQTADGETLITLKNPLKNTYYLLSNEGWFVYERLDGEHSLSRIMDEIKKELDISTPDFVYELISDLINGGFAFHTSIKQAKIPRLTVITYDAKGFEETIGTSFEECFPIENKKQVTWVNLEGLEDLSLINKIAKNYNLHELSVQDILNVEQQRAKIEMFDNYIFIALKSLKWDKNLNRFVTEQVSLILGNNFVLSFQKSESGLFDIIKNYLTTRKGKYIREHSSDFLIYRLIDIIVDNYFDALEKLGDQIEKFEELILASPRPENSRALYRLKRQVLVIRKAIWPLRESVSQLLHHIDNELVTSFTALYLRDLYDRIAQVVDTVETYRDIISGMLDAYLSTLSMRMNEIVKVLTIISTIFIPITFITGLFGMNFVNMTELESPWGFRITELVMILIVCGMLIFFRRKKWI